MKEVDIGKPLIRWLEAMKWEVYQEVQMFAYGDIADIVAVQDKLVWVLELKTSLTTILVEQAWRWLNYANYVSVVTPPRYRKAKGRIVLDCFMRSKGIGHIEARMETYDGKTYRDYVNEVLKPRLARKAVTDRIRGALCDAHRTYAEAGNPDGKRWSPFQETARLVREEVERHPGCSMKQLVEAVDHHYASVASFKCNMAKYIRAGIIDGIRVEQEGRKLRFYPETQ